MSVQNVNKAVGCCKPQAELQLQLLIVFTGKTLGARAVEILKPKVTFFVHETIILMGLKKRMRALAHFQSAISDAVTDAVGAVVEVLEVNEDEEKPSPRPLDEQKQYLSLKITEAAKKVGGIEQVRRNFSRFLGANPPSLASAWPLCIHHCMYC